MKSLWVKNWHIFSIITVALVGLGVGVVIYMQGNKTQTNVLGTQTTENQGESGVTSVPQQRDTHVSYLKSSVARHSDYDDCWVVHHLPIEFEPELQGKVYDISDWISSYPGEGKIWEACGNPTRDVGTIFVEDGLGDNFRISDIYLMGYLR